jgi:DsbC/DsbD-like thiol-disulfide interchange protein
MAMINIPITMSMLLAAGLAGFYGAMSAAGEAPAPHPDQAAEHVKVRAATDVERVSPGQTFHIAVVLDITPKWHIYWKNPGEGAAPPQIELHGPEGFEVGQILWPRPSVLGSVIGDMYVYEHQVVLFMPVKAPMALPDGRASFSADVNWAVCDEKICVMESGRASTNVRTVSETGTAAPSNDPLIAAFWKRLPAAIDKTDGAKAAFDGTTLIIEAPAQGRTAASIIPDCSPGVALGKAKITIEGDRMRATIPVEVKPNNSLGKPMTVGGLVMLGSKFDDPCYEFSLPVKNQ